MLFILLSFSPEIKHKNPKFFLNSFFFKSAVNFNTQDKEDPTKLSSYV